MNNIYDYIVKVKFTKDNKHEDYVHPVQAYSLSEAMTAAVVELEAEYGLVERGYKMNITSVRPDVEKVAAQNKKLIDQLTKRR